MPTETTEILTRTFSTYHESAFSTDAEGNGTFIEGLFAATKMFNEILQEEGREAVLEVRHNVQNSVGAAAWIGRNDE